MTKDKKNHSLKWKFQDLQDEAFWTLCLLLKPKEKDINIVQK